MNNLKDKLVVALDYEALSPAMALVDELDKQVNCYKIGPTMFVRYGTEIIEFLHSRSKKIFLDLKLYDTPQVVGDTIRQLGDLGIAMATVHCLGGHEMLEAAAKGCRGTELALFGVTLLTSQTGSDFGSLAISTDEVMVGKLLDTAIEHRLAGVLCSARENRLVRERNVPDFQIVNAGIRLQGKPLYGDDQKRFSSPFEAVQNGADYLIVGRPLTQASQPKVALHSLIEGMDHEPSAQA